jgi:class 3 adenylate cyclase/CHASE2 domain-containing sensor protein
MWLISPIPAERPGGREPLGTGKVEKMIWIGVYLIVPLILSYFWHLHWMLLYLLFLPLLLFPFTKHMSLRVALVVVMATSAMGLPQLQGATFGQFMKELNYRVRDAFFKIRGFLPLSEQIVLVDLNPQSIEELGQWPWPRTWIAQALENLQRDGAKVIGFDIVFSEADRTSLGDWYQRLSNMGLTVDVPGEQEGWGIKVERVKMLLLKEWHQRLVEKGVLLQPLVGDESPIEAFLSYEDAIIKRVVDSKLIGVDFQRGESFDKAHVLEQMLRNSRELFFLSGQAIMKGLQGEKLEVIMDNDAYLGAAFERDNVVAGGFLLFGRREIGDFERGPGTHFKSRVPIYYADGLLPFLPSGTFSIGNTEKIHSKVTNQGLFNIVPDSLGTARYYSLAYKAPHLTQTLEPKEGVTGEGLLDPDNYIAKQIVDYEVVPSLALEMLRIGEGYSGMEVRDSGGHLGLHLLRGQPSDEYVVPIDTCGEMLINFFNHGRPFQADSALSYPKSHYFQYVSLSDVIKGSFPEGTFKDKYVLIGSTDPTHHDFIPSSYSSAHPGLAVHANALEMLLTNRFLIDSPQLFALYIFLFNLIGGMLWAVIIAYADALVSAIYGTLLIVCVPLVSYYLFARLEVVIDLIYPWLSLGSVSATGILMNYFTVGKESRFITKQFSTMVSEELLNKIKQDPHSVSLAGHKAQVTVMFSDVANFTTISEKLPPATLVKVLNDYLTPMTHIILARRGFIDKFIGDAIMACWGIPYPDEEHAVNACYACLEQQVKIEEIASKIRKEYEIDVYVRMGVATGEVSAALMGSEQRKSYTVMGDTVNLAARLEPACKDYHCKVLISEGAYLAAREKIVARCVDKIVVKGKSQAIAVYELIGKAGEVEQKVLEMIDLFERGLKSYWERRWDESLEYMARVLAIVSDDYPAQSMIKRIEEFKLHPPPESWQGETIKTTK